MFKGFLQVRRGKFSSFKGFSVWYCDEKDSLADLFMSMMMMIEIPAHFFYDKEKKIISWFDLVLGFDRLKSFSMLNSNQNLFLFYGFIS